jgi:hypothetical protein
MIAKWSTGKDSKESCCLLIDFLQSCLKEWREPIRLSVSVDGDLTEIRTWHLPNTSQYVRHVAVFPSPNIA